MPRFSEGDVVAIAGTVANEGVLALAIRVTTVGSLLGMSPIVVSALTLGARETNRFEHARWIELLRIRLEFGSGQVFDLL